MAENHEHEEALVMVQALIERIKALEECVTRLTRRNLHLIKRLKEYDIASQDKR